MLIRRQVIDQIGYLDERFFAYQKTPIIASRRAGQDADLLRPAAQVTHFAVRRLARAALPLHFRLASLLLAVLP